MIVWVQLCFARREWLRRWPSIASRSKLPRKVQSKQLYWALRGSTPKTFWVVLKSHKASYVMFLGSSKSIWVLASLRPKMSNQLEQNRPWSYSCHLPWKTRKLLCQPRTMMPQLVMERLSLELTRSLVLDLSPDVIRVSRAKNAIWLVATLSIRSQSLLLWWLPTFMVSSTLLRSYITKRSPPPRFSLLVNPRRSLPP